MAINESRKIVAIGTPQFRNEFWTDSEAGYHVDDDKVDNILRNFRDKNVRITIEILEEN